MTNPGQHPEKPIAINYASGHGLVDFYQKHVWLNDRLVELNGVQFAMFAYLVNQRDSIVRYNDLLAQTDRGLRLGEDTAARRVSNGLRGASLALEAVCEGAGDRDQGIIQVHLGQGWSISKEWSPPEF